MFFFESFPSIHPFLVHFPIALFAFGVLADLALLARFRLPWLDRAGVLAYAVAAFVSVPTAVTGKISADSLSEGIGRAASEAIGLHGDWAFATVVLFFVVLALRFEALWRDRSLAAPRPSPLRIVACIVAVAALFCLVETASRGGELVYRHGVGVRGNR